MTERPSIADLAAELTQGENWHYCSKRLFSFVNRSLNLLGYQANVLEITDGDVAFRIGEVT